MPIKWTPETDQILLLKLLETSGVNVNYKAIAEAWPKDQVAPTARAISEHIIKIRQVASSKPSAGHFTISGSPKATPRKGKISDTLAKASTKKGTNGVKKNRAKPKSNARVSISSEEENLSEAETDVPETPTRKYVKREVSVKAEFAADDAELSADDDVELPTAHLATVEDFKEEGEGMDIGEI